MNHKGTKAQSGAVSREGAKNAKVEEPFRIEALHIVALDIDAREKEGTPEHAEAVRLLDEAKALWREQFNNRWKCPHCGGKLRA